MGETFNIRDISLSLLADNPFRDSEVSAHSEGQLSIHCGPKPIRPSLRPSFDFILCDNVVDQVTSPRRIGRVDRRRGVVDRVMHVYGEVEQPPETSTRDISLFEGTGLRIVRERNSIDEARHKAGALRIRHMGDRLKRLFFKNAQYEAIAVRDPG